MGNSKEEKLRKQLKRYEEYRRKMDEEELHRDPEELTDPYAYQARLFEERWNVLYLNRYGRFEDNTSIPCKRYTVNPAPYGGRKSDTLQVFSVKVAELTGGLQWPLDVFGMVALRDLLDHNRNIIFKRERESIFSTDRSRAWCCVRWSCGLWGSVVCEGGATESGDKELSLLAASLTMFSNCPLTSLLITKSYTSRLARWTSSSAISFTLRKLQAVCKSFLGQGQIVSMVVSRPLLTSTRNSCCSILKMRMFLSVAQGGRVFRGGVDFTPQGMGAKLSDTISASARWNSPSIGPFSLTVRLS
ncbi:uncharacterized protein LOC112901223 isoform X1 [Panicum hallii]|uniref:uncharacterized protein LOC112901223 isoform X1 n=1 Tax=Panicum hallii TaxID=206008 RepID=UPI000DF4E06E|nr:uncharacterized protein LOC112901223 isoform X1 [Panicum hallii]